MVLPLFMTFSYVGGGRTGKAMDIISRMKRSRIQQEISEGSKD